MTTYLHLQPAYGRDYKSKRDIAAALLAGKDFEAAMGLRGGYITLTEAREKGYTHAQVRFGQLRKVTVLDLAEDKLQKAAQPPKPRKRKEDTSAP